MHLCKLNITIFSIPCQFYLYLWPRQFYLYLSFLFYPNQCLRNIRITTINSVAWVILLTLQLLCPMEWINFYLYPSQIMYQFNSVQSLSHVWLFETPWIATRQASLSITNSRSSIKLMSIESVMPSSHLILCHPLLLLPPIPPSIRVFFNESTLHMRWPRYWSFSFGIRPSNEHPGLISFRMDWLDLPAVQGTLKSRVFSNTTVQKHQFFSTQLSSQSNFHIH